MDSESSYSYHWEKELAFSGSMSLPAQIESWMHVAISLLGAVALAASAAGAFAGQRAVVFAFAAVVGLVATLFRPALQALLPSLAHTPEELIASNGATSRYPPRNDYSEASVPHHRRRRLRAADIQDRQLLHSLLPRAHRRSL